jgi:hypothetical protein
VVNKGNAVADILPDIKGYFRFFLFENVEHSTHVRDFVLLKQMMQKGHSYLNRSEPREVKNMYVSLTSLQDM